MNKKTPAVRIVRVKNRQLQLRYTDPGTKKEVRITTATHDPDIAEEKKRELEAKLLLGMEARPKSKESGGPDMPWDEFREKYRKLKLLGGNRKPGGIEAAEYRLDVVQRILKPRTLADVASDAALEDLQTKLLRGEGARPKTKKEGEEKPRILVPRSPHTVKSYMRAVLAALNWACKKKKWLSTVPAIEIVKVSKLRHAKGRHLSGEEFDKLIAKVEQEVGADAKISWIYTLRGLVESGLRLDELMSLHWTDHNYIVPSWRKGYLPVLLIPAEMQKNYTEELIPMLPGFAELLKETPENHRFGFCFNPMSLQVKQGRKVRFQRPSAKWVGKVISRIGKASGVKVNEKTGKCASAHDLRRTTAQDMFDAEVSEHDVTNIMRHQSVETTRRYYATGNVQKAAGRLKEKLQNVPRYGLSPNSDLSPSSSDTNSVPSTC